jgi:thioredoxin type arsenate reductase
MTRVLILCTGNSARSQMAEGWLHSLDATLDVHSAGTIPAARVHPAAVQAMAEAGVDIAAQRPKAVDLFVGQPFDLVVTVCDAANQQCPAFTGAVGKRLHIGFDDPAAAAGDEEAVRQAFRRVRDQIRRRFSRLYEEEIAYPLRPAVAEDVAAVRALLVRCELPTGGLEDHFGPGYVIAGAVAAVAGVERYGPYGLARSLAVAPEHRGRGLGARLLADRIAWSRTQGLRALYLLTTTAADYLARAGFERADRAAAPAEIRASHEFASACPASAVFMHLRL